MRDFLIHITGKGTEALDLDEWEANPHVRGDWTCLNLQPNTLGLVSSLLSAGSLRGKESSADRTTNDPPRVGQENDFRQRPSGIGGSSQVYWGFPNVTIVPALVRLTILGMASGTLPTWVGEGLGVEKRLQPSRLNVHWKAARSQNGDSGFYS